MRLVNSIFELCGGLFALPLVCLIGCLPSSEAVISGPEANSRAIVDKKILEDYKALESSRRTESGQKGFILDHGPRRFSVWAQHAEGGCPFAQVLAGECYYYGGGVDQDFKQAVKWYHLAAEQGNASCQYSLGYCYYSGVGDVAQDFREAVKWFRLAAEQGDAQAQFSLGLAYDNGDGVKFDRKEAVKWYRLAAEQGQPDAQVNLGTSLASGLGVRQDVVEAEKWLRLAAMQGDPLAEAKLRVLSRQRESSTSDSLDESIRRRKSQLDENRLHREMLNQEQMRMR